MITKRKTNLKEFAGILSKKEAKKIGISIKESRAASRRRMARIRKALRK